MLPSHLLRVQISKGDVRPRYAPVDSSSLEFAERIIKAYENSLGRKKAVLLETVQGLENEGFDYKLVRGLATLLERRCSFIADSSTDPKEARRIVFEEASRRRSATLEERKRIILDVGLRLSLSPEALEQTLWSDVEEELVLTQFDRVDPSTLVKCYNLALAQTLLFKCLRFEFTASSNWKNTFRAMKWLGLMYSVEQETEGFQVSVDGPLSLFKMTDRYGTSLAKLLPHIIRADSWKLKADIIGRRKNRIFTFEANSHDLKDLMEDPKRADLPHPTTYDSSVEERFAKNFIASKTGWTLRREPEPLPAGRHVLIPDFSFEKQGVKVYLEVVGFWTEEYLKRKIGKLSALSHVDMLVAVDEGLACSSLHRLTSKVIYYSKDVPLKPILDHLKTREEAIVQEQVKALRRERLQMKGDIVSLEDLAASKNVLPESVKRALDGIDLSGYRKLGDYYVVLQMVEELRKKIETLGEARVMEALGIIEAHGFRNPETVLEDLGFTAVWEGLDDEKSRIKKRVQISPPAVA